MPGEGLKWWGAPPDHFILSGLTNFDTTCTILILWHITDLIDSTYFLFVLQDCSTYTRSIYSDNVKATLVAVCALKRGNTHY